MELIKLSNLIAKPVTDFAPLRAVAEVMIDMLDSGILHNGRRAGSVALHHAQVSATPFNFFVMARPYRDIFDGRRIIVNGRILDQKELLPFEEGCLSFLDRQSVHTRRFNQIKMTYQYPNTENVLKTPYPKEFSFTGFSAFVIQHELDHANGKHIYDGRFDEYNPRVEISKEKAL